MFRKNVWRFWQHHHNNIIWRLYNNCSPCIRMFQYSRYACSEKKSMQVNYAISHTCALTAVSLMYMVEQAEWVQVGGHNQSLHWSSHDERVEQRDGTYSEKWVWPTSSSTAEWISPLLIHHCFPFHHCLPLPPPPPPPWFSTLPLHHHLASTRTDLWHTCECPPQPPMLLHFHVLPSTAVIWIKLIVNC